jgi:DHA2 family multidrug resistance protein
MVRSLGSSAGISILQAGVTRQSALAHSVLAERVVPGDPVFTSAVPSTLNPASDVGIQALNGEVTRQASMIGYDNMFTMMIAMVVIMAPLLLMVRTPPRVVLDPSEVEVGH